ncbi:GPW/gp25 family protein [Streptomyces sp. NPDC005962]|uniref:GPW/gp25 family protein n=1 Tax=Streptomyces sp. NPDC005962 TaxID=3154466 RepID=UPI0033ED8E0C
MGEQFVGAGWGFPMRTDASGGIALVQREREVEEAIRLVLSTAPGERPMRPEFGCAIHDLVFAPVNEATAGRIRHEVRASLDRWEPRIDVSEVGVAPAPDEPAALLIDVRYEIRGTNNPRSLVFPFYVIPSHEGPDDEGPDDGGPRDENDTALENHR